jgi:hypothetical protein
MRLWREHLGIEVVDAVQGRDEWDKPIPASRVLPYDRNADKDPLKHFLIPWDYIDPDVDKIPECQYRAQPRRMRQLEHVE